MNERHLAYEDARKEYGELLTVIGRLYEDTSQDAARAVNLAHIGRSILESRFPELKLEFR